MGSDVHKSSQYQSQSYVCAYNVYIYIYITHRMLVMQIYTIDLTMKFVFTQSLKLAAIHTSKIHKQKYRDL